MFGFLLLHRNPDPDSGPGSWQDRIIPVFIRGELGDLFGLVSFLVVADLNNKEIRVFIANLKSRSRQPRSDGSEMKDGSTKPVVITLK